ncbi:MAG: type II secretion system protein [Planctomycetaceae bacterium]
MESREQPPMLAADPRPGFTLVELMVTIVIITILASLSLAGLNVTRGRARADATRSTIRKLNEIIIPQYEHYMRRRVRVAANPSSKTASSQSRLLRIRTLQMREMPDTWADVYADVTTVNNLPIVPAGSATDLGYLKTSSVRAYARLKSSLTNPQAQYGSEECLYMIVARSGYEPDVLETFRSDEIADKDGDGAPEFIDGWGTPIAFLRWAPGHSNPPLSFVQTNSATTNHDPFDPQRVDSAAYNLVPLIVSAGADASFGLNVASRQSVGWNGLDLTSVVTADGVTGATDGSRDAADNISNHMFASE